MHFCSLKQQLPLYNGDKLTSSSRLSRHLECVCFTCTHTHYSINNHLVGRRRQFRYVLPCDDFVFQWGTWSNEIIRFEMGFTLICLRETFIRGMAVLFLNRDSIWDILCYRLPEGYDELGVCSWRISMNTIYGSLTLPTLRAISGVESIFDRNLCMVFVFSLFLTHACLNVFVLSYSL